MNFFEDYDVDKHVDYMKKPKKWGDHAEIIALCGFLNINIDLYTPSGIRNMSFYDDNTIKTKTKTIEN